jgi:DNA-binding YbaB/EbfC family protein
MFKDMEQKQQELQNKLASIIIEFKSDDGMLTVKIDANKMIKDLSIDPSLLNEKEMLEDLLVVSLNEVIRQAEARALEEMQKQLGDFLPDFNGLGSPFTA